MIPEHIAEAVDAALQILPGQMDSERARVMLFGIGLQESRFEHRRQLVKVRGELQPVGPAKSFWQGELTGGMCSGVKNHPATRFWAHHLCQVRRCDFTARAMWNAIESDDVLAAGLARLLLFSDPRTLPQVDDANGAWNLYIRTWRPGKPHRQTWDRCHADAVEFVIRQGQKVAA
jgi:hypothetical protein